MVNDSFKFFNNIDLSIASTGIADTSPIAIALSLGCVTTGPIDRILPTPTDEE